MREFISYRGRRIRPLHLSIYRTYILVFWSPFFALSTYYAYFHIYPILIKIKSINPDSWSMLIFPLTGLFFLLLTPFLFLLLLRRYSFIRGGFFYRVYQRQMLARLLKSNGLFEKNENKSKSTKNKQKITFPKVYFKHTKEYLFLTVPTDGMKWHDRFEKIAKTFEEMYISDFIGLTKEIGFTTYQLMSDVISKRITIEECSITDGKMLLMDGVVWDYDEVPHMLITGGTGGGKTYLILTLIHALVQVGTVDICDPKEADLKDLQDLPLFRNHIFYGTKWITRCLKNAVEEMNRRYVYMKLLPSYKTGKNYSYYNIPPYFIVIDEWAAFFTTLSYKEQDEILGYVKQLVLKARQAGVFLIIATQRPDTDSFGSGVRDNILFRVSVGKLQDQGYRMTFGSEQDGKLFINKPIKGRGYVDDGQGVPREFYSPYIPKDYDFIKEFSKINSMVLLNTKEVEPSKEEIFDAYDSFNLKS